MGLFDIFKTREETPELSPPIANDVLLKALIGSETITREKALTLPVVSGAVDFISNAVACMPVKLYKIRDGKVEEVEKDPRTRFLNCDTGDTLDAFQMKKAMVIDYLMGKGGYCYIRRNRNEVTGLFYVEDIYINILRVPEPIYKDYQIMVMGKPYRPYDFVKLLRNTKDGGSGIGLTQEISKELETAYQTLIYQLGMVKSGGNKKGFLKSQRKLGQDEINVLKSAWANLYQNATENVVVLNNGLEFQEASNNSVEMQMNESKKTLRDEINDLFHIYPNDFERTFKEAIYPIVKAFETALNRDLLLEKEKKNYFFELDVKEIIRVNIKERYESYKLAKETGFLTINEIRRQENLNWIEGLDVVNVGLGAVLYDVNEHVYYTPNTDTIGDPTDNSSDPADVPAEETTEELDSMLEGHELAEAYDESGNSAERAVRFNPNHGSDGKFAPTGGGGVGGGSGGSALSGKARSQTWDEFKKNVSNKDMMAEMKAKGIMSPKALREYWVQEKLADFSESDTRELSLEEAIQTVRNNIGQNVLDGWFVDADSDYKPALEEAILGNKDVRNAGLNIAYHNYIAETGSDMSFGDYLNTNLVLYRGTNGQSTTGNDVFSSYTTNKSVAESFGSSISSISVTPLDTLGSYQTTAESEYLVPVSVIGG